MKIIKNIIRFCAAALVALPFVGCQQEELVKPSALMSDSSLTFAATDAEPQMFTIASDDEWMIDVAEDWLTVSPMAGSGTQEITVTVNDNVQGGVVNRPRQSTLTIANKRGYSVTTIIYQNGDNYLGVNEMPISDIVALEDAEYAKVAQAQVMALTSEGFVVTDNSGSIYVKSNADVAVGDVVYLAGEKSTLYGNAVLMAGDVEVKSNAEVVYPTPVNLEANLDPSNANKVVFVSTYAGLLGSTLKYEATLPVTVGIVDPKAGLFDLEAVNMHNLDIKAYFLGIDKGEVKLALATIEDKGINDNLKAYFFDDFSWMKPLIEEYEKNGGKPIGDSVSDDKSDAEAPNLRTKSGLEDLLEEFLARGYEDLNQSGKVIYPQRFYWKFGKSSKPETNENYNGGIKLPELELRGSELVNIDVEFDWSPHMTGSGNIDKVSVVVEIEGSGTLENGTKVSDPFMNECAKGDLKWHHVKTMIRGANNTTRITIRPYEFHSTTPDQQRWHVDNIKVSDSDIPYSDPVYANVTLSDELVTFEGTPAGPFEIKIKSDNPWTLTKGVNTEWFDVDVTEGLPGEEVTVTVTCQESSLSTLRSGSIMLASADTRKNIYVVQSAAGGELDPLISVVGGNVINVNGFAEDFTIEVQSNVDYKLQIDADWLTEKEVPATRGVVEKFTHTLSKKVNLTGVDRTAILKFVNEELKLAFVATVIQEKFEPVVTVSTTSTLPPSHPIAAAGETRKFTIESNVPYAVTTDASWVKLPASQGPASKIEVPITFEANTGGVRAAKIIFTNPEFEMTKEFYVYQNSESVLFADDFSWMKPYIDAYAVAAGKPIGDTVGSSNSSANAPNAYSDASWKDTGFWEDFKARGYENTNPDKKVLYPQDAYLKFGKTGAHSGLYLPSVDPAGGDIVLTFNWCAQVQGSGTVDPTKMLVELQGEGTCVDTGTKISTPTPSAQGTGTYAWQTYSVVLKGVTPTTRILIRHNDMTSSKAIRFHLDNIKITK